MSSNKVRIDELASTGEALDTDTLLIETANGTKKITKADMFKEVKEELDEVKQSVSNGKQLVASAITDRGIETLANDTFQTMADNIQKIEANFFGDIIIDKEEILIDNVKTDYISVTLSQRPSGNQVVTITPSIDHIILSQNSLTFTTSNWNVAQKVIISHQSSTYEDHQGTITFSSPNVDDVIVTLNVRNSELIENRNIVSSKKRIKRK